MREMKIDKDSYINFFFVFSLLFMIALMLLVLSTTKAEEKSSIIENYNKVYAALSDTQKHKADSLPPVCAEETFNEYRCARRTDLLEKAYVFSDDNVIQSGEIIEEVAK